MSAWCVDERSTLRIIVARLCTQFVLVLRQIKVLVIAALSIRRNWILKCRSISFVGSGSGRPTLVSGRGGGDEGDLVDAIHAAPRTPNVPIIATTI